MSTNDVDSIIAAIWKNLFVVVCVFPVSDIYPTSTLMLTTEGIVVPAAKSGSSGSPRLCSTVSVNLSIAKVNHTQSTFGDNIV